MAFHAQLAAVTVPRQYVGPQQHMLVSQHEVVASRPYHSPALPMHSQKLLRTTAVATLAGVSGAALGWVAGRAQPTDSPATQSSGESLRVRAPMPSGATHQRLPQDDGDHSLVEVPSVGQNVDTCESLRAEVEYLRGLTHGVPVQWPDDDQIPPDLRVQSVLEAVESSRSECEKQGTAVYTDCREAPCIIITVSDLEAEPGANCVRWPVPKSAPSEAGETRSSTTSWKLTECDGQPVGVGVSVRHWEGLADEVGGERLTARIARRTEELVFDNACEAQE